MPGWKTLLLKELGVIICLCSLLRKRWRFYSQTLVCSKYLAPSFYWVRKWLSSYHFCIFGSYDFIDHHRSKRQWHLLNSLQKASSIPIQLLTKEVRGCLQSYSWSHVWMAELCSIGLHSPDSSKEPYEHLFLPRTCLMDAFCSISSLISYTYSLFPGLSWYVTSHTYDHNANVYFYFWGISGKYAHVHTTFAKHYFTPTDT